MNLAAKIRVIQVVGLYQPAPLYGTAFVAKKIAERTNKEGIDSYVLTTDLRSYHPYAKLDREDDIQNGVKIRRARTLPFPKLYPYLPLDTYQRLSKIINKSNAIIHAHTHLELSPTFAALYRSLHKNGRFVLQPHFHPFPGGNIGGFLIRQMHEITISKFLISNADAIIVMSEIEMDTMRKSGADEGKIRLIPHGIQEAKCDSEVIEEFKRKWRIFQEDAKLVCVSRVSKDIIEFFVTLLDKLGSGFSVIIAGGVEEKTINDIKRVIPRNLRNKMKIFGFLPREELNAVYGIGDYFVKPTKYEAFGIAFLEAMAAGLPILSYKVGALPEIIEEGKNGFLFTDGDNEAMAQKIKELQRNKKLYEEISTRNKEKSQRYNWDDILERYIEIYEELARDIKCKSSK